MLDGSAGEDLVVGGVGGGQGGVGRLYRTTAITSRRTNMIPNWNWGAALQDVNLYYTLGRTLADGTAWPNWYPTAEFRAVRDKSRAEAK